jgi:ATP-binding cassette subfamily B protein
LFFLNAGQAFIIAAAMGGAMIMAAVGIVNKTMTLGDFVLINAFMMQVFLPLNFLGFVYREMKGALVNIESMFNLLHEKPGVSDVPDADTLNVTGGAIEFRNVHFHYQQEREILRGVNLIVKPKQKVAIVGTSGAGKSTLFKLLFRFYDVSSGSITIDGQDIRSVSQHSLRSMIGVVPQDTVLFNTSLVENIRYGRIEATDEEVKQAIFDAQLEPFINSLPSGWDTVVGERGLKLSGGEKQRVAIARAILKKPPIMVFDEATSSLDSHAEKGILQAMNNMSHAQTTLVIAHRLSTIVDSDIILVLDKGIILESGTHQQLLNKNEVYAGLWKTQQKTEHIS